MDSQSTNNGSTTSSRNSSNEQVDSSNTIKTCLKKSLDSDSYTKFVETLDYIGPAVHEKLFLQYNKGLLDQLKADKVLLSHLPVDGYTHQQHVQRKIQYFAFRFISNTAQYCIKKYNYGEQKGEKYFLKIAKILLKQSLLSKNDSTANLALVEFQQLCHYYKHSTQSLYYKHKSKFLRLIIKAILEKLMKTNGDTNGNGLNSSNAADSFNSSSSRDNCVSIYMTRALDVFNVSTLKREDLAEALKIIANLAHKDTYDDSIKLFLDYLASYQRIDKWTFLNNHIQAIIVGMLLEKKLSSFDLKAALEKLASFCGKGVIELFQRKISFIKAELLLHFSIDTTVVTQAICFLSRFEKKNHEQPFRGELEEDGRFIEYLYPDMIGILLGVDSFISSEREFNVNDRIQHVQSICKLLTLLDGKQIQAIHHKLLSTLLLLSNLRIPRDNEELNKALVELWQVFVNKLSKELRKSLFVRICIYLYDILEDYPDAAIVYEIFFSDGAQFYAEELKFLFFIPDIPTMNNIYNQLTNSVKRDNKIKNNTDLKALLDCVLPLLSIENQKSRIIGLTKMKQILKENRDFFISCMSLNQDGPLNGFIPKMIECLIALTSTQDEDCLNLIAECLGILGAVNPVRLDHLIYGGLSKLEESATTKSMLNEEFKIELIEKLKVSLFSDRINESESANYALQVVIKNCTNFQEAIKAKLSLKALKACQLCQNTHYGGYKKPPTDLSIAIYEKLKMDNIYSYKDWLEKFSWNLISTIKSKVEQEIFGACSYVFKYNLKFAEYLLPKVITYMIINQSEKIELIRSEVFAILNEDVGDVSTQDLDKVYSDNSKKNNLQTLNLQCANIIFCCLDASYRMEYEYSAMPSAQVYKILNAIKEFNDSIPKDKLALLAGKCRSHARALYYFNLYLSNNKNQIDKYATPLQKALVCLDDTYEAAGIEMIRTSSTTIEDDIANYEACGKFDRAFTCCTASCETLHSALEKESLIEDSLRCLSNQGNYLCLYDRSQVMLNEYVQYRRNILPYAIEAAWKLNRWDDLESTLKAEQQLENLLESSSVSHGYLLMSSLKDNLQEDVLDKLRIVRKKLIKPLSIAMMDKSAYFRGYQSLVVLHSLGDFDLFQEVLDQFDSQQLDENTIDSMRTSLTEKVKSLLNTWKKRNNLVEPSIKTLEPLLMWQRCISVILSKKYSFLKDMINVDIGRMWLSSAELARESKIYDRSFYCLTQAQKSFGLEFPKLNLGLRVEFHMEQARLDWDQGEKTKAIRNLKLFLERLKDHKTYRHLEERRLTNQNSDIFPQLDPETVCKDCEIIDKSERDSFAKLKLLVTQYSEEAAAGIPETLFFMYEECVHLDVNQEETYFRLARYYDKLSTYYIENPKLFTEPVDYQDKTQFSQSLRGGDRDDVQTKLMEHSIMAFGNSLRNGSKYLRESMPKLLNIWLDLGTKKSVSQNRNISSRIERSIRFIEVLRAKLPAYYFMTAISLLLSRIHHSHSGITQKTGEIIELLLIKYPHQLTWLLEAAVNDKDNANRSRTANLVINGARRKNQANANFGNIISSTQACAKLMRELCPKYVDKDPKRKLIKPTHADLCDVHPKAERFDFNKFKVILPIQSSLRANLPVNSISDPNSYEVFKNNIPYIVAFEPKVRIFNSLQQPKSVTLRCSDGKKVALLLKNGDDLRKDSRCTEFLDLLNKILRRNSKSDARFVEIKTYLVLPLDSVNGIIEMVPNCTALRGILESLYKEKRNNFTMNFQMPKKNRDLNPQEMHEHFLKVFLPKTTPAVLPTWFLRNFTEPTSWYMARLAFTRSTAVISMGGYIIGLGDRHLDNIMIDTTNGGIVHVDFNLLFHQAEDLATPERVPFRLTHNIVAAFGPVGTEGNFRKFCEITMGVMRKEKDALLTTLKPFLHDPCSEWVKVRDVPRSGGTLKHQNDIEQYSENTTAKHRLEVIERKLRGFPRSRKFKPLTLIDSYSVEAQVDSLIEEAADTFNLAQMYYGWCPSI